MSNTGARALALGHAAPDFAEGAPLVTILTPTYNHSRYIGRCIESVIRQTETRWEQLIVDDGSSDETAAIVAEYPDSRIRYVRSEHVGIWGLGDTYNAALRSARGQFIAILEGDDFWPVSKLERQLASLADPEVVLSWGIAGEADRNGDVYHFFPPRHVAIDLQQSSSRESMLRLLDGNYIPACTVVCRRTALERIGGFWQPEGVPVVDYPTWLRLSVTGRFQPVSEVLGYWRRHDAQVTNSLPEAMAAIPELNWAEMLALELTDGERGDAGLTLPAALRLDRDRRARRLFEAGRTALRDGIGRKSAMGYFARSFRLGSPRTRVKAVMGIACSLLRVDLDMLVRVRASVRILFNG